MHSYLEDGYEMPFDSNTLSNAFKSMGSHFCTNIILLVTFLSLQILCGYLSAPQTGTDRFVMVI